MSTAKHTPWRVSKRRAHEKANSVHIEIETDESLPLTVAHVVGSTSPLLDSMAGASSLQERARLIAAAPELLSALEALLEWHCGTSVDDDVEDYSAVQNAYAAITKATKGTT